MEEVIELAKKEIVRLTKEMESAEKIKDTSAFMKAYDTSKRWEQLLENYGVSYLYIDEDYKVHIY